jgi:hypothetical protein
MRLYDFSVYAQRKRERQAAEAVVSTVACINNPGAVVELKSRVNDWFVLHREVLRRASS